MKKVLFAAICSVLLFFFGLNAYAVDKTDCTATATVIRQIVILETNGIDFGNIYDTINQDCRMDPSDGSMSGDACASATGTAGVIQVQGSSSGTVDIEVVQGADVNNIAFEPALDNVGTTALAGQALSAASPGALDVKVGGLLTVSGTQPAPGATNFSYTFRCTYP
nr:DUF4402 domain-containing protein [uncultured Desulfobacter sp.]